MYKDIIDMHTEGLDDAVAHFDKEAAKLRTGRANPSLVDCLEIENYGVMTPLKQVANISTPEARQLLVQPWDKTQLEAIEKAITAADVGAQISNDGLAVRVVFPPMTEENRVDLVKVLNNKAEEARVTVRNVREDIWKEIQKAEKDGTLTEDDKFAGKDALQEVVDTYNQKIEDLRKKKEAEILTV